VEKQFGEELPKPPKNVHQETLKRVLGNIKGK